MSVTVTVREFRLDGPTADTDAEAAADIWQAAVPFLVTSARSIRWLTERAPAEKRYRMLLAEADGRILGAVRTGMLYDSSEPGQAFADVCVHPERRGRGAGRALLAAAQEYLAGIGGRTLFVRSLDDPRSLAFAERAGFRRGRSASYQRLDLTGPLPPVPAPAAGVEVRTGASFAADLRPIWETDNEAAQDEPDDVDVQPIGYDVWYSQYWDHPHHDPELTSVVTVDGVVASLSYAVTDGRTRYVSGFAATRRAYRRRGLAKLAKASSLRRARTAGYREAYTSNDTGNAPMLAVNRWLGYQPSVTEWRWIRDLT